MFFKCFDTLQKLMYSALFLLIATGVSFRRKNLSTLPMRLSPFLKNIVPHAIPMEPIRLAFLSIPGWH